MSYNIQVTGYDIKAGCTAPHSDPRRPTAYIILMPTPKQEHGEELG
jgi:hypothetical protein